MKRIPICFLLSTASGGGLVFQLSCYILRGCGPHCLLFYCNIYIQNDLGFCQNISAPNATTVRTLFLNKDPQF